MSVTDFKFLVNPLTCFHILLRHLYSRLRNDNDPQYLGSYLRSPANSPAT